MVFDLIVWAGVAVSVLGLMGLVWSIIRVARARRTITDDEALRTEIQKALPINLGALFLSVIGLMMVMIGIFLG